MKITSTDKKVRIRVNDITTVYPLYSLAYEVTQNGVSIFTANNERIYTAPISQTSVNGETLTSDNSDSLLDPLFKGAQVNPVNSVNGQTGDVIITKSDIELGNVENLSIVETVNNAIEDIEIGGANLLLNSNQLKVGYSDNPAVSSAMESDKSLRINVTDGGEGGFLNNFIVNPLLDDSTINENNYITISYWMKCTNQASAFSFYLKGGMGYYNIQGMVTPEYKQFSITVPYKKANTLAIHMSPTAIGTYWLKYLKIEKSNIPTDWTPASDEVQPVINYSSDEQFTGKRWVNGHKIYQKTIDVGTLPDNGTIIIPHGIANIRRIIDYKGSYWTSMGVLIKEIYTEDDITENVGTHVSLDSVIIKTARDRTVFDDNYVTLYYTCNDR